ITTSEGTFRLTVPASVSAITVSSVGYEKRSVATSQDSLIILLTQTVDTSLNAVVVVGYGTQKKGDLTSAITQIDDKDFNKGGARNAMDLIQGKVAGLTITRTSGSNPNSGPSI